MNINSLVNLIISYLFATQLQMTTRIVLLVILAILPILLEATTHGKEGLASKLRHARSVSTSDDKIIRMKLHTDNDDDDDDDNDDNDDNDDDNSDSDDSQGSAEQGSGDDSDDDRNSKRVVCKKRCAPPMTYDECANPRCAMKHSIVKNLCYFLCRNQQIVCRNTCEPEE